jgi:hypothetical protein
MLFEPCEHDAGRALLLAYLSPGQREAYAAAGHFDVDRTGAHRSLWMRLLGYPRFRVYRLSAGRYPVALFTSPRHLARGEAEYVYCVRARDPVPRHDELLSLKLLLEHDEPRFVRIATRFRAFWSEVAFPPSRLEPAEDPWQRLSVRRV